MGLACSTSARWGRRSDQRCVGEERRRPGLIDPDQALITATLDAPGPRSEQRDDRRNGIRPPIVEQTGPRRPARRWMCLTRLGTPTIARRTRARAADGSQRSRDRAGRIARRLTIHVGTVRAAIVRGGIGRWDDERRDDHSHHERCSSRDRDPAMAALESPPTLPAQRPPQRHPALAHGQRRRLQGLDELQFGLHRRLGQHRLPGIAARATHARDLRRIEPGDDRTQRLSRPEPGGDRLPRHRQQHTQVGRPRRVELGSRGAEAEAEARARADAGPVEHHRPTEADDPQRPRVVDQQCVPLQRPVRDPDRVQRRHDGRQRGGGGWCQRRRRDRAPRHRRHHRDGIVVRGAQAGEQRRHGRDGAPRQHLALRAARGPGIRNPHLHDHRRPGVAHGMRPEDVRPLPHRHELGQPIAGNEVAGNEIAGHE